MNIQLSNVLSDVADTLGLSRELGIESSGQALAPLSGLDAGLHGLSARLPEYFQAIAQRFPAVCG